MEPTADELAMARAVVARGLEEDLRYGPDVTTLATVPDGLTTAAMVTRQAGVAAGVDLGMLVLDEVLGRDNYRVLNRGDRRDGSTAGRAALDARGGHSRSADR